MIPYAIVRGNHDNEGFLNTAAGDFPSTSDPWYHRETRGFNYYFHKTLLDDLPGYILYNGPGGPEDDSPHVQENPTTAEANEFGDSNLRRGTSHIWKFALGPYEVGVIGVTHGFGYGLEAQSPDAHGVDDKNWAVGMLEGPLADVPVFILAHRPTNNVDGPFGGPLGPFQSFPEWLETWSATGKQRPSQVPVALQGHYGEGYAIRDRALAQVATQNTDPNKPLYDPNAVLFVKTQSNDNDPPNTEPPLVLVRFHLKGIAANATGQRDEVEVISVPTLFQSPWGLPPTVPPTSPAPSWRKLCSQFSIFYEDFDRDTKLDHQDNCPSFPNPGQQDNGGKVPQPPLVTLPDGIGDACQCGDVSNNGQTTSTDALHINQALQNIGVFSVTNGGTVSKTDAAPYFLLGKCDVGGLPDCTSTDSLLINRAALDLPPGIAQKCKGEVLP